MFALSTPAVMLGTEICLCLCAVQISSRSHFSLQHVWLTAGRNASFLATQLGFLGEQETNNRRDRRKREQMSTHSAQNCDVGNKIIVDTEEYKQKMTFNCLSVVLAAGIISNWGRQSDGSWAVSWWGLRGACVWDGPHRKLRQGNGSWHRILVCINRITCFPAVKQMFACTCNCRQWWRLRAAVLLGARADSSRGLCCCPCRRHWPQAWSGTGVRPDQACRLEQINLVLPELNYRCQMMGSTSLAALVVSADTGCWAACGFPSVQLRRKRISFLGIKATSCVSTYGLQTSWAVSSMAGYFTSHYVQGSDATWCVWLLSEQMDWKVPVVDVKMTSSSNNILTEEVNHTSKTDLPRSAPTEKS